MAERKSKLTQEQKFIDKARELGVDEDEGRFKATLRQIARADVPLEHRKKPKRKKKSTKSTD